MIRVSYELPTKYIQRLKPYTNYDFLLAQKVLKDPKYRNAYEPGGVMDNGQFELGEPLSVKELHMAVRLSKCRVVIAPDWLGERERTVRAYREAATLLECEVAGVVQGTDVDDMIKCFHQLRTQQCDIFCLPFRLPRMEMMRKAMEEHLLDPEAWYHFLGLVDMRELQDIKRLGLTNCSIDTSKPVKAGIYQMALWDDLRGLGRVDLDCTLTEDQLSAVEWNCDRFQREAND